MTLKPQPPKACRWPGCMTLATKQGCCPTHLYKWRYWHGGGKLYDQRRKAQDRSIKLLAWYNRDRRRFRPAPPLTQQQQLIKQQELNRLYSIHSPQTSTQVAFINYEAAKFARKGGFQNFQHQGAIRARMAGWRRRWLREGTYDSTTLETGIRTLPPQDPNIDNHL